MQADYHFLLKLIPILSFCELSCVSQRVPLLHRIVHNFMELFGVTIEPCCLRNGRLAYTTTYNGLPSLALKNLSELEARNVIPFFPNLKHLTMEHMTIEECMKRFPRGLTELTLIDCKIKFGPMYDWMKILKPTLRGLHMENVENYIAYQRLHVPSVQFMWHEFNDFNSLRSLTFTSKLWTVSLKSDSLEFLTVISDGKHCVNAPQLKHLYCDVTSDKFMPFDNYSPKLTFPNIKCLTVSNWESFRFVKPHEFPSLEEVQISAQIGDISSVHSRISGL